jgi:uncharacterized protein YgiM (DUF1202 family)
MGHHAIRSVALLLVGACAVLSTVTEAQIKARINTDRVSVRAKASIFSEVVAQLQQGDEVTVLEVIKHENPRQGEPSEWVKIKMPSTRAGVGECGARRFREENCQCNAA